MLIYVSGNVNTNNWEEKTRKAENFLKLNDLYVINPMNIDIIRENRLQDNQVMKIEYALIDICDGIYMLKGWQKSKKACAELTYAKSLDKKIIFEGYYDREKKETN